MPVRDLAFRSNRTFQAALLASVSALTLVATTTPAHARNILAGGGTSPVANASAAAMASVQQAQAATVQARNSLAAATQAIQALQQAQSAARNLSLQAPSTIPSGLGTGGLQVAPGIGTDPTLWQNAQLPTESASDGQTTVTIQQTAQKAILTWQSFNLSKDTTVHFDQTAGNQANGNNNWIALNRVQDPSGVPSQILGTIKAEGSVYLINRNGIIFGGSSQIDVHTLIASSLGFLGENVTSNLMPGSAAYDNAVSASNALFLNAANGGIAAPEASGTTSSTTAGNLVLGLGTQLSGSTPAVFMPSGAITIQAGAAINTHANGTSSDGGFVLIAAPAVTNAGTITTTDGQAILAAGIGVSLLQSPTQWLVPELTGRVSVNGVDVTPAGSLVNTGLVQATTGNVTLLGSSVTQAGVVGVTTSVSRPGSIVISTVDEADIGDVAPYVPADRRAGALVVSGIIANLPEEDGQSVPASGSSFTAGRVSLTGGSVWLQNGALIEAPGASVSVAALSVGNAPAGSTAVQGRIYIDNGAVVDVAGLSDVQLPMSSILVTIPVIGQNELADSPLLRTGFLKGLKNVVIDSTLSGTTTDGLAWVGSPILNAAGYAQLIPRKIDQLLTNGGAITLSGGQVMTAAGSSLNLDGGYVHYLGGTINTTRLIDASGHIVDIGRADPTDTYVGIAGRFSVSHGRWGVTTIYGSALLTGGTHEPDYIQGGNAGSLSVFGGQATVLDGAISGQAFAGIKQMAAGEAPAGTASGGNFLPGGGSFILGAAHALTMGNGDSLTGLTGGVSIRDQAPDLGALAPDFGAGTALDTAALTALGASNPDNVLAWTTVPADTLNSGGFANVTITEDDIKGRGITVADGTTLAVQPGGSITLNGGAGDLSVLGKLIAPSGAITVNLSALFSSPHAITVGPNALISAAGQWVNDLTPGTNAVGAATFVNGGSISLKTAEAENPLISGSVVDATGSILLEAGSILDVSSGGVMLPTGQLLMKNGIPVGKGGSISLVTYNVQNGNQFGTPGNTLPGTQPTQGRLVLDGTLRSAGFSGGGTLTLQGLGFQIGGDPTTAPAWDLSLPADFFQDQGFGNYVLSAVYDATIAPGTTVRLTQQNLLPNLAALQAAATGASLWADGLTSLGTLDAYHRQATGLTMTAGDYTSWSPRPTYAGVTGGVTIGAGATILADAGASIDLRSLAQVTVLGSIVAHGGSVTLEAANSGATSANKSVWLGANATLDVSGVALQDPLASPLSLGGMLVTPVTGKVLAGGTVSLSNDSGFVVTEAGSVIDVSGAAGVFDQLQARTTGLGAPSYALEAAWSDAGTITLAAGGLYADGTLRGQAGAPQGEGGTLTILPQASLAPGGSAKGVILQQSGDLEPDGLAPGQSFGTPTYLLRFAVDRLKGSGLSTLVVGNTGLVSGNPPPPVPIAFAGDVTLDLGRAVILNTSQLLALPAGAAAIPTLTAGTQSIGGTTVSISAPYVEIAGTGNLNNATPPMTTPALADGKLVINAGFIDLTNQVALGNFGAASFTSSGDIRLSSTNTGDSSALQPGELFSAGNLTFKAADLYPASGEGFIIDATGPAPTTVTFLGNGASGMPLSAGGSLLVDAATIVQSGTVRAPSGSIVLGVGNAADAATLAQFGNLPLTNTQAVSLTAGSVTSVSLDGAVVPYGVTIDGTEWQYGAVPNQATTPVLTAPPSKIIAVNGANVALDKGAVVDLSGGGDLQAIQWVPGTGGSRDVLSQYNLSYPASGAAVATPLYPDARNIYAILPGAQAPVAAYDPVYAQVTLPTTQANGTASSQTAASGVGQAAIGGKIGQSVYLAGVPGLPDGVYTLLPAKYATLPGAYRVVENTGATNVVPGQSVTTADGTHLVSGYYVDGLSGATRSTVSQFEVQSAAVWQQYSAYSLTSANTFFPTLAANAGHVVPPLPIDAGRLVLAATNSLVLQTTLQAAAAAGGAAAEVDIAAQDIQIVGSGEPALAGYLQLSADGLDALGAGSLLIGGTRTPTTTGVTMNALADSVVVSNDATNPLTGPEIILVTKTDPTGTDPNAANGLRIDGGSIVTASGSLGGPAGVAGTTSGDGATVRVSNGGAFTFTRTNLPTTSQALLTVGAGAVLAGGQNLTLDSSGTLHFDPAASFSGHSITVDAGAITFTNETAAGLPGFVVGQDGLAQFAHASQVALRSYGAIGFVGNVTVGFGNAVELSAGSFTGDGGTVILNAPLITFTNALGAPVPTAVAGSGSLTVNASEIDLGARNKVLSGFGAVTMAATGGIVGQNTGTLDLGAANATLAAPVYLADTGSNTTLKTTGALRLNPAAGPAPASNPAGGAISFVGATVADNGAAILAPGGNISLRATGGDLTLAGGSLVSSAGVSKAFYDIIQYAPGGAISLTADTGAVVLQPGATLDFSGAKGGGAAGSLTLSAPVQSVQLNGTLKGGAAAGFLGGSFSLDTGGAIDLDNLTATLASSGVDDAITVHTRAGNLTLSAGNTLTAHAVSLTADGGAGGQDPTNGNVNILGTINAAGTAGGEIDLYGKSGVDLEGSLIATGSSATKRGGTVNIGTVGNPDTVGGVVQLDPTYGYELVSAANSGAITLGANALIDVSGGAAGGLSGGTVSFRAPLLANGDVNVTIAPTARIKGSRSTTLEAFAVWSTTDPLTYGASKHFDGLVDPAGWYNADGTLVSGSWTDQSGNALPTPTADQLASYLANDYFTPSAANTDHQTFYGYQNGDATAAVPGTLMGFVENFPIASATTARFANIANFAVTPGIELDNPDPAINGGNITVLTNWNLGAGSSPTNLAYRYKGQAPTITFKAENDFQAKASLSDGFFQVTNPISPGTSSTVFAFDPTNYGTVQYLYSTKRVNKAGANPLTYYGINSSNPYYAGLVSPPVNLTSGNPAQIAEYYAMYEAYADYLQSVPNPAVYDTNGYPIAAFLHRTIGVTNSGGPTPPSAQEQAANPLSYFKYVQDYATYSYYALSNYAPLNQLMPPAAQPVTVVSGGVPVAGGQTFTFTTAPTLDNTPSPVNNAANPLPLTQASLNAGSSTSYRLTAGADFAAANPGATRPASSGDVTLDGHLSYFDKNNQTINAPTMIRTGTGSIDIAAANDVLLLDTTAPGAIYTAGTPAGDAPVGTSTSIVTGKNTYSGTTFGAYDLLATGTVNPDAAGDISIRAGNDIAGIESLGNTGAVNNQFWWPWMQTGNSYANGQIVQTSINFGGFDQGVMSVGGNVAITAGGNIANLAVSLPTTWYLSNGNQTVNTVGGGDLTVKAGGDILSGDYFVARGTATLTAGGSIGSSGLTQTFFGVTKPVSTVLAAQDAVFNVSARQGADIGAMVDPSYLQGGAVANGYGLRNDAQSYSPTSALNLASTTGDVALNTLTDLTLIGAGVGGTDAAAVLPSTVTLTAFTGGISIQRGGLLYPSATGQLSLIADRSIQIYGNNFTSGGGGLSLDFGLIDAPASSLPSPLAPLHTLFNGDLTSAAPADHASTPLHAGDSQPVRIYSLNGDIVDGFLEPTGQNAGLYDQSLLIGVDKPAQIYAATDIVNLNFLGQNLRTDDITRIVAGHDILDVNQGVSFQVGAAFASLNLGGPGTFDVEAGHDISLANPVLLTSTNPYAGTGASAVAPRGIVTLGNSANPYLPHESADIEVLFGVGKGIANAAFIQAYVDPAVATPSVETALIAFMQQYDAGQGIETGLAKDKPTVSLTLDQAWSEFQALPAAVQQIFNQKALFTVLADVGKAYNDPTSAFYQQYARGYQAINTLFPAGLGYTANSLAGGTNGGKPVPTGNLDIRSSAIQTQQGGNITILGPGGQALVGAAAAAPSFLNLDGKTVVGPSAFGILTLEQGNVNIFTDQSLLLAQSRVFTEQGGDMVIWSSNGDINAGKGAKTIADVPPPLYVSDDDHYNTLDARGEVTGAGIATLQTIPGAAPGSVYLIAPRGTVDAGAAGIRVSGNLFVAALQVANADNIQVQGTAVGVPHQASVDVGGLTSASNAAGAAANAASDAARQTNRGGPQDLPSIITVEVIGYGGSDGTPAQGTQEENRRKKEGRQSENRRQDPRSRVQVLAAGDITEEQARQLMQEKQAAVRQ
ncbi:hypothetical protein GCM10011611_42980 [Aliidongia dinghuensis]|uniref:Filamentous haemagglutinin FhaB/tRNA nuclease CdiA-like TPS domain-containing protein n=1 Tax=Aliidongia dinghuensis TaxID=1867774 RepID=A0A8J2YWI1_9PROT|nr:filamentous haemagglutinin family protein [Aliidongia dinghuensis]GGF32203.1 hypothetical protein GCM10011611_42980 [Aliidongia dinghuensis]